MRTNIEILNELRSSTFIDEDGEEYKLEFGEGLTEVEIEALSERFPNGHGFYSMVLTQHGGGISVILLNNTEDFPRSDLTEVILEALN